MCFLCEAGADCCLDQAASSQDMQAGEGSATPQAAATGANISGLKWGDRTQGTESGVVTWSIAGAGESVNAFSSASGTSQGFDDFNFDVEAQLRAVFNAWSAVANIDFVQVEDQGGAATSNSTGDIRIFAAPIPGSTIGVAFFPREGDMVLDTSMANNPDLFFKVALHELGHSLGFGHTDAFSIMQPRVGSIDALTDVDISGAREVYGQQDNGPETYNFSSSEVELKIERSLDDLTVNGNSRDNTIFGGDTNETLNGGSGNDLLSGGRGRDRLDGGSGTDTATYEDASARVRADLQNTLSGQGEAAGDSFASIENLIGSRSSDNLRGNAADNRIEGGIGADHLFGRAGEDVLRGQNGADRLQGNSGADDLGGGQGADTFIYNLLTDSRVGVIRRDVISDFGNGNDIVDLARIDADTSRGGNQSFEFIGRSAFTGDAGELRFFVNGVEGFLILQADVDGDRAQDFQIEFSDLSGLSASDFIL
ncbi:MAG: matrixin family metalloprotease [Pseudomonadota bacterium]